MWCKFHPHSILNMFLKQIGILQKEKFPLWPGFQFLSSWHLFSNESLRELVSDTDRA